MIVEHRTYTAKVGKVPEWLSYYEVHGFPVQQKYLGRCIGFFTTEIGPLHQVVHMWAYDSLAHREQARAELAKDPAWHEFLKNQPDVLVAQESKFLNPTSFSPLK